MIVQPRQGRPYANPYLAGFGLGLVLLSTYVLLGRGLGASGAFNSLVAHCVAYFDAEAARANSAFSSYLGGGVASYWLVVELAGVLLGGFASAWLAGRARWQLDRGAGVSARERLGLAVLGGVLMGIGARFARGCTSGQALTGGAMMSTGSWIFIVTAFASGYLLAPLIKGRWR
jgi:uncharacterized membrane protein YedE/YeeE